MPSKPLREVPIAFVAEAACQTMTILIMLCMVEAQQAAWKRARTLVWTHRDAEALSSGQGAARFGHGLVASRLQQ